jgi:hypothetical protein
MAVEMGINSTGSPPSDGVARYTFDVPSGTYKIIGRVIAPTPDDDSFWLRIQGTTTQTSNHSSGWVRWNDIAGGTTWHWDEVHSSEDASAVVEWTMSAGSHTLEIAFREDGAQLDCFIVVPADFSQDDATQLDPLVYDLNDDGVVDDADVALLMDHWLEQVLWP